MPARVFVTGLDGFTGTHLEAALRAKGYAAVGPPPNLDLRDANAVREAIAGIAPDYVINLAGISFVQHGDLAEIYAVNTIGAMNLLGAIAENAPAVRKVILVSSANVYGNTQADPITEEVAPMPVGHYGCSKLAMEHMARAYFDRLPIVIVRPFNYTGVGQARSFLVPKIVWHFAQRAARIELGNLNVVRDFSDVRSVVEVYCRLLAADIAPDVYNLCSGTGRSLRSVIDELTRQTGHAPEIATNPAFVRGAEVHRLVGGGAKLERAIGRVPAIPFADTLAWMLAGATAETHAAPGTAVHGQRPD